MSAAFEELGLAPELLAAIADEEWLLPTGIQNETIPLVLGGGDICAAAETGSGKTGAFSLPAIQLVIEHLNNVAVIPNMTPPPRGGSANEGPNEFTPGTPLQNVSVKNADGVVFLENMSSDPQWRGLQANEGSDCKTSWMFEVECVRTPPSAILRLGFSLVGADVNKFGTDVLGWGYGGTGKKVHKGGKETFMDYGVSFTEGDFVGCYIDSNKRSIGFSVNGKDLGAAFALSEAQIRSIFKPTICGKGSFKVALRYQNFKCPVPGFGSVPSHAPVTMVTSKSPKGSLDTGVSCLVLEPTRDLALQTNQCMTDFAKYTPEIKVLLVTGGGDSRTVIPRETNIVVGTVPLVTKMARSGLLNLKNLKILILDEADDLVKENESRRNIQALQRMPKDRPQTLFFSATLHGPEVLSAIDELCRFPTFCDLKGRPSIPETVHSRIIVINPNKRPKLLPLPQPPLDGVHIKSPGSSPKDTQSQVVKQLKPQIAIHLADTLKMDSCLIFCRTNVDCDNFEAYLNTLGGGRKDNLEAESGKQSQYTCVVLAGRRSQQERDKSLRLFKLGRARFLICTDVAARGLDISKLPFLIMLCLPDDPRQFIHRVGRVGREGRIGLAVSIVSDVEEKVWYHKCNKRGPGCENRKLLAEGGCTIYYDEMACLKDIETLVDASFERYTIEELVNEVNQPEEEEEKDQSMKRRNIKTSTKKVVYGASAVEATVNLDVFKVQESLSKALQAKDKEAELEYLKVLKALK